jgi:hypothetical protein
VSRYGDDPVHRRRVERAYRREIARLVSEVAVRAAADSGALVMPALPRRTPRSFVPQQRSTPPD